MSSMTAGWFSRPSLRFLVLMALCLEIRIGLAEADTAPRPIAYAIAIHGGAGSGAEDETLCQQRRRALERALTVGVDQLKQGRTSLDAVEAVIRLLEDAPQFNAGKGAVFNAAGIHELDASIMDGRNRGCGAVGGVRTVRNPISLARRVMTGTRHVLLISEGAERFAKELEDDAAIDLVENHYFSTPLQRQRLRRAQAAETADQTGTVGCVALDRHGNLAAGTSTGGLTNKRFGRIGDSPIIGAGTYADNETCAVSATGIGEDFIRHGAAFDVSARMQYRGQTVQQAVRAVLEHPKHRVRGGLIAVSAQGEIAIHFNTPAMVRAAADSSGRWEVAVGP
jgi:beta-aspartyl-peptidase (threonine type)